MTGIMNMPRTGSKLASPAPDIVTDAVKTAGTTAAIAAAAPPWQRIAARGFSGHADLAWLADRQAAALARIVAIGLPDTNHEAWRHTSLDAYTRRWSEFLEQGAKATVTTRDSQRQAIRDGADDVTLDLVNGQLARLPDQAPRGLEIQSLRQLPATSRETAATLLQLHAGGAAADPLVDLNTALLDDGLLIATEAGQQASPTVHLRSHVSSVTSLVQTRLLVDVRPGSRLTLIVEHDGAPHCLSNTVLQIRLGRDSQLNLVRVQAFPGDGLATETSLIELAGSAKLGVTSVDMGAQLSRQTLTVLLAGADATAEVQGMFLADGRRHIDNQTSLVHGAPATVSRETYLGIADDHGHGVFGGRILVLPGAAGSNAALTNRNLLLTPTAEIDTKPELEIYVDDVRCSHGATIGQLDANALFYLQSRGVNLAEARQILTIAFLRKGLAGIPDPALRARLDGQLQARLNKRSAVQPPPGPPS